SFSAPAVSASSTAYWMSGLSTIGNISLGEALVAGRNQVPRPATGNTAQRILVLNCGAPRSIHSVDDTGIPAARRQLKKRPVGSQAARASLLTDELPAAHSTRMLPWFISRIRAPTPFTRVSASGELKRPFC